MQSHYSDYQSAEDPEALFDIAPRFADADHLITEAIPAIAPFCFQGQFEDCMEMYADATTVAEYLNAHRGWFTRCAHPMKANPLGENGYALVIGRFGSYGYVVEPQIGLELLPADEGIYRIRTIPVPNYVSLGYEVDFNAAMNLVEVTPEEVSETLAASPGWTGKVTRVEWQLDLVVSMRFPKFVYRLPKNLIQTTGDRVLRQIVRQVNRRLTYKVQEDFHTSLNLPMPQKQRKW